MKTGLAFLFIILPLFIFSQTRDTTFEKVGEYEFMEIREIHKLDSSSNARFKNREEEKAYYLKRNFTTFAINERLSYRDSIIYFHENEKIKKIHSNRRNYTFNYDEDWKLTYVHLENHKTYNSSYMFWEDLSFEIKELNPSISGKFGEEINFEFVIKNRSLEKRELDIASNHSSIKLESSELFFSPNSEKIIRLKIKIPHEEPNISLILSDESNQKFNFPFDLSGYDLDDNDFFSSYFYKDQMPFDVGKREDIVIKLDNGERLLRIYHENELVWNHPIGRIINKVNIAYLESGEYLLEIVDLKNNEKRYCRIRKEGAD